ncbi:peptidylprolyl isomerase [Litorimonas sp.]|uniref:peptidylprolyl isomerase n=1 Tax=Litorimonas sp. TaxID=1892381 RepID=UPI003A897A7C
MIRLTYIFFVLFILGLSACTSSVERPIAVLETTRGTIEIEVYIDKAPISGADFMRYVENGYYNGEGFYRVVRADNDPMEMGMSLIQGGRLDSEPVTPPIEHELTTETGLSNTEGVVSIARLEPGTGSATYFFINIGDNSFLDYGGERNPDGQGYATFGKVVSGMEVVREIQAMEAKGLSGDDVITGQILTNPVKITVAYRK